MAKVTLAMELSKTSIQKTIKKLQNIKSRTSENMKLATIDLMGITFETLKKVLIANNLSNHIDEVKKEITNNGLGFRIWTTDMIIIFNEYGTGITGEGTHPEPKNYKYNVQSKFKDEKGRWVYYNDETLSYVTTDGMQAKHMFYDVEQALNSYASQFYSTAVNLALNDKQYQKFRKSLG